MVVFLVGGGGGGLRYNVCYLFIFLIQISIFHTFLHSKNVMTYKTAPLIPQHLTT